MLFHLIQSCSHLMLKYDIVFIIITDKYEEEMCRKNEKN